MTSSSKSKPKVLDPKLMNDIHLIEFCSRAPFATLRVWHRAAKHVHMLDAIERTYGAREARVWLTGRVLLDEQTEFRPTHFQPDSNSRIPHDSD